jgi:hypothetical protein
MDSNTLASLVLLLTFLLLIIGGLGYWLFDKIKRIRRK